MELGEKAARRAGTATARLFGGFFFTARGAGRTGEGVQREVRVGVVPGAHQHGVKDIRLLLALALGHHLPAARGGEIGALGHAAHAGLGRGEWVSAFCSPLTPVSPPKVPVSHPEADVPQQVEAPGVHAEVLHDLGVVHVVGEVVGDGEVAEAHHLLGGVDDDGAVDAGAALLRLLLRARGTAQRPAGPGPVQVTAS